MKKNLSLLFPFACSLCMLSCVKEDSFNQQQGLASGTGNNSYSHNYYQKKAYDPDNDVSVVSKILLWDLRDGLTSFLNCFNSIYDAAYPAREALGYPGKP